MSTNITDQRAGQNPRVHMILSALIMVIGLLMLIVTVSAESEPTAIPLLLIVSGIGWYVATRHREDPHPTIIYRLAVGIALSAAFLLVWLSLGVGIIGADGDPANVMYFGVLAVGTFGAFVARFQPRGMALALFATALAQAVVFMIALIAGLGLPWSGPMELLGLNGFFVAMFVGSALIFRQAERSRSERGVV